MTRLELWITVAVVFLTGMAFGFYISQSGWHTERDALRERVEWQSDSLRVYETWWVESQRRNEYIRVRDISGLDTMPVITACTLYVGNVPKPHSDSITIFKLERLNQVADDYDSVVLIDGILYERATGAKTAWNDGVADEH